MDFTRTATFLECPEKFRLAYLEGLSKIQDEALDAPRKFGEGIHAALQAYYEGKNEAASNSAFLTIFPEQLDPMDEGRTPANGLTLLNTYRQYWLNQDREFKVLGVEVVDQVDIGASEPWEVKLDVIVETPNGIMGVDHKTTSKPLGELYWRQFEPNSQVSGYTYYLLKKYGQCSGFLINGIQVGFRKRAYKGEPAGFHWSFQRQLFNRSQEQLEDWRVRMGRTISRMHTTTEWEKNERQCGYCQFRELCLSCGNEQVRDALYERVEPLAYMQKER